MLQGSPHPRQAEFFACTRRYVAYGGARGGGKSWALRRKLVLMCCRYPNLRALLLRRSLPELRENHLLPLLGELQGIASWSETHKTFSFPNGARLRLGYCDGEGDVPLRQPQRLGAGAAQAVLVSFRPHRKPRAVRPRRLPVHRLRPAAGAFYARSPDGF